MKPYKIAKRVIAVPFVIGFYVCVKVIEWARPGLIAKMCNDVAPVTLTLEINSEAD